MKKICFIFALVLAAGNLFANPSWDILDKSMAAWNVNGGAANNQAWSINQGGSASGLATQQNAYVNFTKTNVSTNSGYWSWVRSAAFADLTSGTAYSIEVKARVRPVGIADSGSYYEASQISLRSKGDGISAPIYLKYGDGVSGGFVSTTSGGTSNVYTLNTAEWQIYRLLFHANHSTYDVYVEGVAGPILENIATISKNDDNGVYFGAEGNHRCNIDVEYVKMGTGDFYSNPKISSIVLSRESHIGGNETTISVTAYTYLISNGEKLLFSLIDGNDSEIIAPVEATVENNMAATNLVIPANLAYGQYAVKLVAKNQINGITVTPKTLAYEIKDPIAAQTWDILDRDFSVKAWNLSPAWALEKGGNVPANFVTQQTAYVNINKTQAYGSSYYAFLISPAVTLSANTACTYEVKARAQAINKNEFPDVMKPAPGNAGGYEANQIGFLLNNRHMSIYLIYGDENTGYVASPVTDGTGVSPSSVSRHALNTSEWHVYRLIYHADNTKYDIYVDGALIFEDVPLFNKTGSNVAKIGGESWQRCNMDVEYVKMATGDLISGDKPKITSVDLSSDSHIANNARTIQITANTSLINNGEKLLASLAGENGIDVISPVEITVNANKAVSDLTIPATVPLGKYSITIAAPDGKIGDQTLHPKIMQYVVADVSPLDAGMLPQVKPVGFVKEMADYTYFGPSKEFIFPSIVDTKKYTVDGKFKNGTTPIDRYYLYYAPHENPGGIYLSTAPTLDGPWTEYSGAAGMTPGTVMDFAWAETQSDIVKNGAERHISACQVVWNDVQNKYIMYFHGPNSATHYATSENLVNWTFGATILIANQFSPIGAEASYAKAFEHEIPGLGNKYVLLLMNQENQIRRIYWAHSTDGINWTPVAKPLVSPDLDYKKVPGTDRKPNFNGGGGGAYGNNVSGPFLMKRNGRYFVICHDSADNLHVVEVGESLDMEVHWGEYMKAADVILNVNGVPKATRPAAVDFIQDDKGKWYMFFEAGGRLDANIAYAKEEDEANSFVSPVSKDLSIYPSAVKRGEKLTVHAANADELSVEVIDLSGNRISSTKIKASSGDVRAPLAPGLYFVKVSADDSPAKTVKIIVR